MDIDIIENVAESEYPFRSYMLGDMPFQYDSTHSQIDRHIINSNSELIRPRAISIVSKIYVSKFY